MEQASKDLEASGETTELQPMQEMVRSQIQGPLRSIFLSSRSPGTDSSLKLGTGMAVAFNEEGLAVEMLERVRDPDAESTALSQLVFCSSRSLEAQKNCPSSFRNHPRIYALSPTLLSIRRSATRLLPTTVRQRLEAVSVRLAGDIARAEQVEEAYSLGKRNGWLRLVRRT